MSSKIFLCDFSVIFQWFVIFVLFVCDFFVISRKAYQKKSRDLPLESHKVNFQRKKNLEIFNIRKLKSSCEVKKLFTPRTDPSMLIVIYLLLFNCTFDTVIQLLILNF